MASDTGVNLIKKKVATLKTELDEAQSRASEAEEQLAEKETIIEKVLPLLQCSFLLSIFLFHHYHFSICQTFMSESSSFFYYNFPSLIIILISTQHSINYE